MTITSTQCKMSTYSLIRTAICSDHLCLMGKEGNVYYELLNKTKHSTQRFSVVNWKNSINIKRKKRSTLVNHKGVLQDHIKTSHSRNVKALLHPPYSVVFVLSDYHLLRSLQHIQKESSLLNFNWLKLILSDYLHRNLKNFTPERSYHFPNR